LPSTRTSSIRTSSGSVRPRTVNVPRSTQPPSSATWSAAKTMSGWLSVSRYCRDRTVLSRAATPVSMLPAAIVARTAEPCTGSATRTSPARNANVPRTAPSPNMCLVTKLIVDSAGSSR
jgi:hypothetical protein